MGVKEIKEVDQVILPHTDPNIFLKYLNYVYGFQSDGSQALDKILESSIEDVLDMEDCYVKVKVENDYYTSEEDEEFKDLEFDYKDLHPMNQKDTDIFKRTFKCTFCGKEFSRSDHLNRHIATHTGIKQFQCDLCGKEFARKDKLKLHKSSAHNTSEEQKHYCSCGLEFVNEYDFYDHKQDNPEHMKIENNLEEMELSRNPKMKHFNSIKEQYKVKEK